MSLLKDMLKIDSMRIWSVNDNVCVSFNNYADVLDGVVLKGIYGTGNTIDEALNNYAEQISGRTLVANAESKDKRKEITMLIIQRPPRIF